MGGSGPEGSRRTQGVQRKRKGVPIARARQKPSFLRGGQKPCKNPFKTMVLGGGTPKSHFLTVLGGGTPPSGRGGYPPQKGGVPPPKPSNIGKNAKNPYFHAELTQKPLILTFFRVLGGFLAFVGILPPVEGRPGGGGQKPQN